MAITTAYPTSASEIIVFFKTRSESEEILPLTNRTIHGGYKRAGISRVGVHKNDFCHMTNLTGTFKISRTESPNSRSNTEGVLFELSPRHWPTSGGPEKVSVAKCLGSCYL